jgi:hypothetical protein
MSPGYAAEELINIAAHSQAVGDHVGIVALLQLVLVDLAWVSAADRLSISAGHRHPAISDRIVADRHSSSVNPRPLGKGLAFEPAKHGTPILE